MSCLTTATCQGCVGIFCQEAGTIAFADNTCHIGLLFHSWISTQGTRHILEITHLIPLILSKSHQLQHTISAGGHAAVNPQCGCYISRNIPIVRIITNHSPDLFIFLQRSLRQALLRGKRGVFLFPDSFCVPGFVSTQPVLRRIAVSDTRLCF